MMGSMGLDISPNNEARLGAKARELGLSVDALLERLMNEGADLVASGPCDTPELPAWHLGARSSFHRRDIYDDVS
jgi:hypothetical protein